MFAVYLPLLLAGLAFVISVFSFFYHRAYIKARTSQERFLAELREEVNSILKTINETTDRDISLIEEREKTLKNLLEEIEKRLKVYVRELEVRRGEENTYRELGKNRYRLPEDSRGAAPRVNSAFPIPEFEVKPESAPPAPAGNPPPSTPSTPVPPVGEQIFSLVRAGFSVPAIASRLGISIAEVEFAVALLERKL